MFRLQAAAKGIEFRYQRPPNLPGARAHGPEAAAADPDQPAVERHQVHRARPAPRSAVRYRSQVAEFEVSDTGVGIPAHELERVFEPFERGQGANVRAIPGTGLGLTITKLLTQIMGGEISAHAASRASAPRSPCSCCSRRRRTRSGDGGRVGSGPRDRELRRAALAACCSIDDDACAHRHRAAACCGRCSFELYRRRRTAPAGVEARGGVRSRSGHGRSFHAGHDGLAGGRATARRCRRWRR